MTILVGGTYGLYYTNDWVSQKNKPSVGHYAGDIVIPNKNYLQKAEVNYAINLNLSGIPFKGKIYEEGTYIKIDNQLIWNLSIKE